MFFLFIRRNSMSNTQIAYTLLVAERRMSLLRDIRDSLLEATRDLAALETRIAAEMLEREISVASGNNRIPLARLE